MRRRSKTFKVEIVIDIESDRIGIAYKIKYKYNFVSLKYFLNLLKLKLTNFYYYWFNI